MDKKKITPEEFEKMLPDENIPQGWVSIEDHLPKMRAIDFFQGTTYQVKYKSGEIGTTVVGDHNTWYYYAKDAGITHWYNDPQS